MRRTYQVEARWDAEAGVWVAESNDIPGLVAEAESKNALVEKIRVLVPELFELNGGLEPGQKVEKAGIPKHFWSTSTPGHTSTLVRQIRVSGGDYTEAAAARRC